jgi:hypothetical protein
LTVIGEARCRYEKTNEINDPEQLTGPAGNGFSPGGDGHSTIVLGPETGAQTKNGPQPT